jgi:ribosomal protein L11 methyltransferase
VDKAHWLEVSLTVDGELAEAVAEVLSRYVSNGVVTERDVIYNDAEDRGTPVGPIRVFGYLPFDEQIEETRQRLEESLWHLSVIQPLPTPTFKTIVDQDWMIAWKKHYNPIPIGRKLLILPAWFDSEYPDRVPVKIDPCMAFGTGTHPSTQLCMQLLEDHVKPGNPFIDVGCGSGILSIAAVKLGADQAIAVDVDRAAIVGTRENAEINAVQDKIKVTQGSVENILAGDFGITQAPLVAANILAPIILRLFEDGLASLVAPDGILLLSGILEEQVGNIRKVSEQKGLHFLEIRRINDWVALALARAPR